jgi:hypothetical protein
MIDYEIQGPTRSWGQYMGQPNVMYGAPPPTYGPPDPGVMRQVGDMFMQRMMGRKRPGAIGPGDSGWPGQNDSAGWPQGGGGGGIAQILMQHYMK